MKITEAQYRRIEACLPRQRGNVSISNLEVLNAILYVAEHGCKWRGLPVRFGNWHTIYTRMNRWAKAGVLDRVFTVLQEQQIIRIKIEAMSLDSTIVKVHPDGTGALKKTARRPSASRVEAGAPRFIWFAADARTAITFSLSPGQRHDGPQGRELLRTLKPVESQVCMIMDRAYEGAETRQLVLDLGFTPVVPPKQSRVNPWEYDRIMYRRRNEIERLFRRLKGFRRIFSRFDKLDLMFTAFIHFALIVEALR